MAGEAESIVEGGPKVLLLSTFIDFVNDIEVTVSRFYVQRSIQYKY